MEKTLVRVKKPALVLSGGGMKAAAFHIGVGLALEKYGLKITTDKATDRPEEDLSFDSYVGASAGSVIASFYATGHSPQDIIYAFSQGKHNLDLLEVSELKPKRKLPPLRYRDIFSLNIEVKPSLSWISKLRLQKPTGGVEANLKKFIKFSGFFTTERLGQYFENHIFGKKNGKTSFKGSSFKDIKKDLFIVATFLDQPKKAIFTRHQKPPIQTDFSSSPYINTVSIPKALTASVALPVIFSPVTIEDNVFFDGEVRDSLNSHIALDHGADLVIISYSMQPYKYTEEFGSLNQYGLPVVINQSLYQLIQHKIVNHRRHKSRVISILDEVDKILFSELPEKKARALSKKLQKEFCPERGSTVLYIHPSARDHEMFFSDHLSLSPKVLNKIITIGFKAAMHNLRSYTFKKASPP